MAADEREGFEAMRRGRIRYSEAELKFIEKTATIPRRQAHAAFCELFGRTDVSLLSYRVLCQRRGWLTGRPGPFRKGNVPYNKGMKMPEDSRSGFRKGELNGRSAQNYKPVGAERQAPHGYIERKVHDGLPKASRWRRAHLIDWEAENGPVPEGHCLKCLDGDKTNTAPSNWICIPRAMLPRLSGLCGVAYDDAPAQLKPVILATAKLEYRARERSRSSRS